MSCLDTLYQQGGFYEPGERLAELRLNQDQARFLTDLGQLFPSYRPHRKIDRSLIEGYPPFIDSVVQHFEWVVDAFPSGAPSRINRMRDVYLSRNALYRIADGQVWTLYETARPIDRPYIDQEPWTADALHAAATPHQFARPTLYLGSVGSFNYGHWLTDDLPRAAAMKRIGQVTRQPHIDILIPDYGSPGFNRVKRDSVESLGLVCGDTQFHALPEAQVFHLKEIYYATPVSYHPTLKSPEALSLLRYQADIMAQAAGAAAGPKRLYVIRKAARGREIENAAEVLACVEKAGFVAADVEGMTFAQQLALFRSADVVVGCMGASMTTTLFCKPGTAILHLAPEGWKEPYYWDLAELLGHRYATLFGAPVRAAVEPHNAPFQLDMPSLERLLGVLAPS